MKFIIMQFSPVIELVWC